MPNDAREIVRPPPRAYGETKRILRLGYGCAWATVQSAQNAINHTQCDFIPWLRQASG